MFKIQTESIKKEIGYALMVLSVLMFFLFLILIITNLFYLIWSCIFGDNLGLNEFLIKSIGAYIILDIVFAITFYFGIKLESSSDH